MSRKLRIEYPGAMYHVMNRGDQREDITRAALSTSGSAKSKFLSAKVKSCCSEGGSPSSLG